jgi:hypothetical protein
MASKKVNTSAASAKKAASAPKGSLKAQDQKAYKKQLKDSIYNANHTSMVNLCEKLQIPVEKRPHFIFLGNADQLAHASVKDQVATAMELKPEEDTSLRSFCQKVFDITLTAEDKEVLLELMNEKHRKRLLTGQIERLSDLRMQGLPGQTSDIRIQDLNLAVKLIASLHGIAPLTRDVEARELLAWGLVAKGTHEEAPSESLKAPAKPKAESLKAPAERNGLATKQVFAQPGPNNVVRKLSPEQSKALLDMLNKKS